MKSLPALILLTISAQALALGNKPHLDPETTSAEYRNYLGKKTTNKLQQDSDPSIEFSIKLGERLAAWVTKINATRSAETAIRLTSPETRISYPIDKPNMYNPEILAKQADELKQSMPKQMVDVIWGDGELPSDTAGLDDKTFATQGRLLDRNYQGAARYKSLNPWREDYKWQAAADVRGYYYFTKNNIKADDLKDVAAINPAQLEDIKTALYRTCRNYEGTKETQCAETVAQAVNENGLADLFEMTMPSAKATWDGFFNIPVENARKDVTWANNTMTVPFNTPSIEKFVHYLQDNIEDEYKWNGWNLRLSWGTYEDGPRLVFKKGEVPHVNGLGGNEITMDSNQPIEEYESRWTIRHEFGHVIGFPDCYHEFFDTQLNAYVNYQLDVTDLMCSRAGNFKQRMFDELEEVYGSQN